MNKPKATKNIFTAGIDRFNAFLIYFAILCFALSWLFGLHIFVTPNYTVFISLIALGAVLLLPFCFNQTSALFFDDLPPFLIFPALFSTVMLPWPYNIAPSLLTAGLILIMPSLKKLRLYYLGRASLIAGIVLMIQTAFLPLYHFLFTGQHDVKWLAGPLAAVFNFLGTDVTASNGIVFVKTIKGIEPFRITWEALAVYPFMLFAGGVIVFMMIFCEQKKILRNVVRFSAIAVLLFLLRYIFVVLAYLYIFTFISSETRISGAFVFWTPLFIAVSFIPMPGLLAFFLPLNKKTVMVGSQRNCSIKLVVPLLALAAFCFTFCISFKDPGYQKKGRILFDSAHSKWEPFNRPYDTSWYGHDSGYNYAAIYSFLQKIYTVTESKGELTDNLLAQNDILILKIPTRSFSATEKKAILKFVEHGGGLFLLGEHTNVFGSGFYINPIAEMFGFSFVYDCVFDIETKFEQMYHRPLIIPHPVIADLDQFLFEVSCSIKPESIFIEPIIRASGLKTIEIDYSSRNFYPQVNDNVDMRFGSFLQAVARRYGKGRVVGFADSTCYSNFSAFHRGKPEFLLGTLAWLNHKNSFLTPLFRFFAVVAFCLVLLLSFMLLLLDRPAGRRWGSIFIWMGFAVISALFSADKSNLIMNPVTTPRTLPPMLAFEREHCDYDLPDDGFIEEYFRSFGIFHQWILRVDYFPRTFQLLDKAIANSECLVLVRPVKDFSESEIKKIDDYVKSGGNLLVIDDMINKKSSSNQILNNFSLAFEFNEPVMKSKIMTVMGRQILSDVTNAMPVNGGTPLLYSVRGIPLVAFCRYGDGMVVAASLASRFSDTGMGITQSTIPDNELLIVYALQFALIKGIMSNDIEQHLKKITLPKLK